MLLTSLYVDWENDFPWVFKFLQANSRIIPQVGYDLSLLNTLKLLVVFQSTIRSKDAESVVK